MIKRQAENLVTELSNQFPAVLILGPRQCGKTTLAKYFLKGDYFDLERPSDLQVFLDDIEFALKKLNTPIIIDEAQTLPGLFPVLRSMIDLDRQRAGRYYLLGSVNPALVRHISESLAGRVGVIELTPFLFSEVKDLNIDLSDFWLKGGFPDALKETETLRWQRWQENYIRTFIERDIPRYGIKMSPVEIRRLMGMIAHLHGGVLNASELGRSMGVSYHTIRDYLDLMEGHFLIRRLLPYFPNTKKRIVKSPKLYIRDSGVFHYLAGVSTERSLLESPKRGSSWEGFMIEQIIGVEMLQRSGSLFFFYRTHAGAEVDLIIDRGSERIGYEFKCSVSVDKKDYANLQSCIDDGIIHKGFVVYMGERNFSVSDQIAITQGKRLLFSPIFDET